MDYEKVTECIFNLRRFGDMKLGLERTQRMLDGLGNPEKRLKYIHIGGTNGKGSTAAMVSSILSYAGYKVGTYTSPHLSDFTERIAIKGKKIPKEDVVRLFDELMPIADEIGKEMGISHVMVVKIKGRIKVKCRSLRNIILNGYHN